MKKILLYFPLVFAIVFAYTNHSLAMTITPVRYEIQGDPGETIVKEMMIINEDEVPVTYYSSFANFEAQGETGSAAFVEGGDGISSWMRTDKSITLSPGEQKIVTFYIDIPENAEPGGHFGVIFWGTSPASDEDGKQLAVSAKTGLLVLLSVNGDVKEEGGLLSFGTKDDQFWYNTLPVTFTYRFRNDGGDRVKPEGKIKIRNTVFIPVKKLDANPVNGNVLPASTRKFNVDWIKYEESKDFVAPTKLINSFFYKAGYQWKNFAFGLYSAGLNISYGLHSQNARSNTYFFVFPWQLLICLAVLLIIVFFVGKKLIKRYNNYIIKKAHSLMKNPDDVGHA